VSRRIWRGLIAIGVAWLSLAPLAMAEERKESKPPATTTLVGAISADSDGTIWFARGARHGLETGQRLTLHPMIREKDRKYNSLDFTHVLATGTVRALEPLRAQLVLDKPLPAGVRALAQTTATLPAGLMDSHLGRVAALAIQMRFLATRDPIFSLDRLLDNDSAEYRQEMTAAMVRELHNQAELAGAVRHLPV
jgi:hypothetical protein